MSVPPPTIDVDGVPLLLGPPADGRCAGGLIFRVGWADETLATAGLTHLTEHLALHFSDPTKLHSNGMTMGNMTHFHSSGRVEEVTDFLNNVTAALRTPPLSRLDTEKSVLRTEASRRGGPADGLHTWRYGARGYGLASYTELGLHRIGADDVSAWLGRWFTRGNVIAWLAADEVPAGLDLTLPAGTWMEPPPLAPILEPGPASYLGPDQVVAASAVVRRSTAASVYASVLEQALYRELRQVGGYSYSPSASYEPVDADHATIYALADTLVEKQDAVVGGFVDVLAELRLGTLRDEDIAAAVDQRRRQLEHPDGATYRLPSVASNLLLGHPHLSDAELLAELDAVDAAQLRAVAEEVHASVLLQVPRGPLDWAGYPAAPEDNQVTVGGTPHPYVEHPDSTVRADGTGIGLVTPDFTTGVRWADAVAVLRYPDGARTVIGADGFRVVVEPNLLTGGAPGLVALVDEHTPAAAVVPMPERDPERIPAVPEQPSAAERRAAERAARERTGPAWADYGWKICAALAFGSLLIFAWGMLQHVTEDGAAAEELSKVLARGMRAALLGAIAWWLHRVAYPRT